MMSHLLWRIKVSELVSSEIASDPAESYYYAEETSENINVTGRTLLMYKLDANGRLNLSVDTNNSWANDIQPSGMGDYLYNECPPIYDYFMYFHKYYLPFIVFVGLLGNFLSCIVFLTTHLKMRSSSYYLAALATADFGFLSVLLLVYLSAETKLEFFNKQGWCQCLVYVSSVCSILSVWLIVAFTVERFIAVQYPLQRPQMCTVSRAKTIVLVLTTVAMASQTYSFVTAGMVPSYNDTEVCEMLHEYHDTMRIINVIDTLVTLIGPLVLIVVMNTMIARNLFLFRRRFQHGCLDESMYTLNTRSEVVGTQTQTGSSNRRNGSQQSSQHCKHSGIAAGRPTRKGRSGVSAEQLSRCIHIKSTGRNIVSTKNQQNITKMLLLISSVFILLNLPSYVIRLYVFFFFSLWRQRAPMLLWCIQQFAMELYYTNFSINFLLYAGCGATFRRCLWQLLRNRLAGLMALWRKCLIAERWCSSSIDE